MFSMKEMWSGGCQSRLYQNWVKGALSTIVLMGLITLGVRIRMMRIVRMKIITSAARGEARDPEIKSFWTSTTTRADLGCTIWTKFIEIKGLVLDVLAFRTFK